MSDGKINTPSPGIRALLTVLSVLLCLCLFVSLLATALIADARLLTSKSSFKKVISQILSDPVRPVPLTTAAGGLRVSAENGGALVSWLYDALKDQYGEALTITEEQMEDFLEQSTVKDFLAEKSASYLEDLLDGNWDTTITAGELERLLEENRDLIERTFGIVLSPEISGTITGLVEDMKIDEMIRGSILGDLPISGSTTSEPDTNSSSGSIDISGGEVTIVSLMALLRILTSTTTLIVWILIDLLLIAALFFTNRRRLPGTLTCVGIPMTAAGALLTAVTAALHFVGSMDADPALAIVGIIGSVTAPVHHILLGLGAALIVAAIVVKVITRRREREQSI